MENTIFVWKFEGGFEPVGLNIRCPKLNCWFLYYTKAANIGDDNSSILGLEGISLSEMILFYIALLADVISLS